MVTNTLPISISENLVTQETGDELLIYNTTTAKALCLNETAALIWKHCDGSTTYDAIKTLILEKFEIEIDDDLIEYTLSEFDRLGLINHESNLLFSKLSRRKLAFKYAPAVLAFPLISSIVAPRAVHAASLVCSFVPSDPACLVAADCPPYPGGCPVNCFCDTVCDTFSNCCFYGLSCL